MSDGVLDEVLAEIAQDRWCEGGCGWKVVSPTYWRAESLETREEMKADGYRGERVTGYCGPCSPKPTRTQREAHAVAVAAAAAKAGEVRAARMERIEALTREGMSYRRIAQELGISRRSIERIVHRTRQEAQ